MNLLKTILLGLAVVLVAALVYPALNTTSLAETQGPTIKKERVKVNSTGTTPNANGTGNTEVLITGQIVRVDIDFATGITTVTDLTLAGANDLVSTNIVNLTDTATDVVLYPHVQVTNNAGTGLTLDGTRLKTDYYPVADILTLSITNTTVATPAVTVDIYYRE
jgi:hypothetical protein